MIGILADPQGAGRPIASIPSPRLLCTAVHYDQSDLTPQQACDLHQEIHRIAMYFNRLATRMSELQFARDDRLFQLVQNAGRSLAVLSKETYAVRTLLHPRASKRSLGGRRRRCHHTDRPNASVNVCACAVAQLTR